MSRRIRRALRRGGDALLVTVLFPFLLAAAMWLRWSDRRGGAW